MMKVRVQKMHSIASCVLVWVVMKWEKPLSRVRQGIMGDGGCVDGERARTARDTLTNTTQCVIITFYHRRFMKWDEYAIGAMTVETSGDGKQ